MTVSSRRRLRGCTRAAVGKDTRVDWLFHFPVCNTTTRNSTWEAGMWFQHSGNMASQGQYAR